MKNNRLLQYTIAGLAGTLLLSACHDKNNNYAAHDAVFKNLDTTVRPGEDFFKYANGG